MLTATTPAWTASWIGPVENADSPVCVRPIYQLTTDFTVAARPVRATLRITAHGIFEAFVNGARIGDIELAPGWTSYRTRLQVLTFDVTEQLSIGANALGVMLSDGWWRGQRGTTRTFDNYGSTTALLAELHLEHADGSTQIVGTNGDWRSRPSHVLAADTVAGETHDLRLVDPSWASAGTDRTSWRPVVVSDLGTATLVDPIGPPVRRVQELAARTITQVAPGSHVIDFGQNSNGWVRLTNLGPAGTELTISHGEALTADGHVTQANVDSLPEEFFSGPQFPFQRDVVISAGATDGPASVFEPRHSTKGFQYVQIDGLPGTLDPSQITSVVVHSDLPELGSFECSDDRINRLHSVAVWSFRGNACEIPTDCPTRERAGWTGDWQLYVETAAYLYDVTDWSLKWLRDLAAEQRPDGKVLNVVPDAFDFDGEVSERWSGLIGSSGWADAVCHVPWELYRSTGRTDVLAEMYEPMRRWVDYARGAAASGRRPERAEARPEALPHEEYLWDTCFHWGEWLEPGKKEGVEGILAALALDMGPSATAFLRRSSLELAQIAEILGHADDAARYRDLSEKARWAWQCEFIDADGRVQPQKQANLVRALAFDLVPDHLRASVADNLVQLIRDADTHLGTGFLATPYLLPVLFDTGHGDVAYELLFQDSEPSWLLMIDRGATTIWEEWEGLDAAGNPSASLNHYSKGAVISFLHRYTAGLQLLEPGYRRFRVAPRPGGGITSASTSHVSPHGPIEVSWRIDGGVGSLDVTVPAGTECELEVPGGSPERVGPGRHQRSWSA